MNIRRNVFGIAVALFLALPSAATAQGTGGSVRGSVRDLNDAPVPGAEITVSSDSATAGFRKSVRTDAAGRFFIGVMPPGDYTIRAEVAGFRAFSGSIAVYTDDVRFQEIVLSPGSVTDSVVVARPAGSRSATPEIRSNIRTGSGIPSGTTVGSLTRIVPGLRRENLASGLQIDGSSGADNTFFLDGQEFTNFRSGLPGFDPALDFVREFQVRSDDISAGYAGAFGGVVNIVTVGGGDRFRGSFGLSFSPSGLAGKPNPILTRYGAAAGQAGYFEPRRDGALGLFPTATVGGPAIGNRLWFIASYSPQIAETSRTVDYLSAPSGGSVVETIRYDSAIRSENGFLRLDSQPSSRLRGFVTYLYNPIVQNGALPAQTEGLGGSPQQVLGLRGADYLATRGGRQNSQLVTGQADIDVTGRFSVTVRAGYGFLNEKLDSYGIPKTTRFICAAGTSVPAGAGCSAGYQNVAGNNVRDFEASKRTTFDIEGRIDGVPLVGFLSFGYGFNRVANQTRSGYLDTGIVQLFYGRSIDTLIGLTPTPGNMGSGFLQRFGNVGDAAGRNQALYVQGSRQFGRRFLLSIGIRFEKENLPYYGDPVYPGSTIVVGEEFDLEWNWGDKVAPRAAAVLDIFGNGKSKVFASFGLYYDRMKFNLFQQKYSQVFYRDYFEILPSRGLHYTNYTFRNIIGGNPDFPQGSCPIPNSQGWSVCQVTAAVATNLPVITFIPPDIDGALKPARTREFTIGFEQRLPADATFSGRYIRRSLDRAVDDIGALDGQGGTQQTTTNPGFFFACQTPGFLPCAKAERRYDAAEFIFDRRGYRSFFHASYTYSRLYGNYSGLANSDEGGRAAPNLGRYFDRPSAGFDAGGNPDNGRLATDRPHVFKAFGGYNFGRTRFGETSVSAYVTVASGTPLTTVYSLYSIQNSILFGRGDLGRTETLSETDLRAAHRYLFGRDGRFAVEPFIVVLNLFDQSAETGRQTQISATNFTATTLTQGGCLTCTSEAAVYQTIRSGGIREYVTNYLNARGVSPTGLRNDYGLPNAFQAPRSVRIGVRLAF